MADVEMAKRVLQTINTVMNFQEGYNGRKLRWFYCFGTMEEYLCDLTFGLNFDVDIGVMFEDCDTTALIKAFDGYGYEVEKVFLCDIDRRPLNIHFKPVTEALAGTPTIDLYAWYPSGNLLYHTYDIRREGREIPRKYIFKGVKREWLVPPAGEVKRIRGSGPEMSRTLDEDGVWHYDVFGSASGYQLQLPFAYGSLLDCWDPGWRFRDFRRGRSKTRWLREVKSCREL